MLPMITDIILPKQGLQMEEGTIVRWLKSAGDAVSEGEPVVEMETDKTTMEIEAPASGYLLKTRFEEGVAAPVGEVIAWVGDSMDETADIVEPEAATEAETASPAAETRGASPSQPAAAPHTAGDRLFSTPRARMTADERGVDIAQVAPSGPDGLIVERDVLGSAASAAPGKRISFDRMRRTIADRMLKSLHEKAQITHTVHLDMTSLVEQRKAHKEKGAAVSYNDLMIALCAKCLRKHPIINRLVLNGEMVEPEDVHIGFAVAVEDGLLVPVVRNADTLSMEEIAAETKRLTEAARQGALSSEDMEGGTFTISNLGMYGIDEFQAIINPPQSAILAVGRIADRVWAVAGEMAIRPICAMTLTYDHCVMDGATAAAFLKELRGMVE